MLRRSNPDIQPISGLINDSLYQTLLVYSHHCCSHFIMKPNQFLKMEIYNKIAEDLVYVDILCECCVDQIKPLIVLSHIA